MEEKRTNNLDHSGETVYTERTMLQSTQCYFVVRLKLCVVWLHMRQA